MYARSIIRARSLVRVVHGTLESMWKCVPALASGVSIPSQGWIPITEEIFENKLLNTLASSTRVCIL